jgi:hypothetical protein
MQQRTICNAEAPKNSPFAVKKRELPLGEPLVSKKMQDCEQVYVIPPQPTTAVVRPSLVCLFPNPSASSFGAGYCVRCFVSYAVV